MVGPRDIDAYILRAVGVRDEGEGISPAGIRETVDAYERLVLTAEELRDSLERLSRAGHVALDGDRVRLGAALRPHVPRTPRGAVSGARPAWERLADEVLGSDAPAS